MPSVGLSGPDIKDDLQADLKLPDGHSSLPQKKLPKFTMPNFHLPPLKKPKGEMDVSADVGIPHASANLNTPDINLPKLDHKEPVLDINGPKLSLNSPDVNAEPINIHTDEPSAKFKWPHLKWKHPKGKLPEAAVNADIPDMDPNLSTLNIQGSTDAPGVDVNLPQADIKGPAVDAKVPNHDFRFGKINWPHLWKKADGDIDANLNTPGSPTFNVDGDINAPDIDLDLPKVETDCPKVDMPALNADVEGPSGKIKWPHLKWKKKKGPKADLDIDATQNMPDLDLQLEDPSLPKVDPDLPTVNAELDAPSGKILWPHLKWKKPVFNAPKSNMDIDADMDINAEISKPEGNVSLKENKLELSAPDAGVNVKDIEHPTVKLKWPTFKKQKRSVPGLNVKDLDADLDVSGVSMSAPNIDGGINVTDGNIDLPKADFESPKLEVDAPDVEAPSGKFKFFKKPLFGTPKTPKVDLNDADLETPELALDVPDLSGPKVDGSIDAPELNITSPKTDVDADFGSKIKLPKLKLPSFKGLKSKTPEVESVKAPDIDVSSNIDPDVSLSLPKIGDIGGTQDIKVSHSGLSAPTITSNLDSSDPKLDLNLSDHLPKLNLPSSKNDVPNVTDGNIDLPKANFESPNLEVNAPDVEAPTGKFKFFKKPIFGTLKTPKLELDDTDIRKPELDLNVPDLSAPKVDSTIDTPELNITSPKTPTLDLNLSDHLPKLNLNSSKIDIPVSKPDLPSLDVKENGMELPTTEIDVPDINLKTESGLNMSAPKSGEILSAPTTKISTDVLEAPDVELKASDRDINLPDLKVSDVAPTADVKFDSHLGDFKSPQNLPQFSKLKPEGPSFNPSIETEIEGPKVSLGSHPLKDVISSPESDLTLPKVVEQEKGSKIDIKPPQIEVSPQKPMLQHFNLPTINFSPSNIETSGLDINADSKVVPDVNFKSPDVEGAISPKTEVEVKDSPKSKIRLPFKWGFKSNSRTDEEGGADSETDVPDDGDDIPQFKFHTLPKPNFDSIDKSADIFNLSKPDLGVKDYVMSKGVRLPIVNATTKTTEKVDVAERLKKAKEKLPISISPSEATTNLPLARGDTFKVEKEGTVPDSDEREKLSLSLSNMLGLKTKDSNTD